MRLHAGFKVPLSPGEAYAVLLDLGRAASWFPGARLEEESGEEFRGSVRVKLGPMVVDYRGTARFLERDEERHRVVVEATGREQRGSGTATARVTTELVPAGGGTQVEVEVDLNLTGRPAQLGQGLMQEVAERLVAGFAERMAADLATGDAVAASAPGATADAGPAGGGPGARSGPDDALDLGRLAAGPLRARLLRLVPAAVAAAGVALLWRWRRRR